MLLETQRIHGMCHDVTCRTPFRAGAWKTTLPARHEACNNMPRGMRDMRMLLRGAATTTSPALSADVGMDTSVHHNREALLVDVLQKSDKSGCFDEGKAQQHNERLLSIPNERHASHFMHLDLENMDDVDLYGEESHASSQHKERLLSIPFGQTDASVFMHLNLEKYMDDVDRYGEEPQQSSRLTQTTYIDMAANSNYKSPPEEVISIPLHNFSSAKQLDHKTTCMGRHDDDGDGELQESRILKSSKKTLMQKISQKDTVFVNTLREQTLHNASGHHLNGVPIVDREDLNTRMTMLADSESQGIPVCVCMYVCMYV
jgi:hypothetical protein